MNYINQDLYWMQKTILLAKYAQKKGEIPVGALLIHDNQLIAKDWNQPICSHDPSAHAEILVLRAGGKYFKNYRLLHTTLYVTLEPCIMCAGAMIHARISRLVYGAYNPKTGAAGSVINIFNYPDTKHRILVNGGILANECSSILGYFFKRIRIKKIK
ncbi:MAG: tRNA adenosine(34) deaminase TadA [Arsenophonus sp.]|nr:MAG: tRNA adenosine(34) deaminase TadA [Arsenophonus sp.]